MPVIGKQKNEIEKYSLKENGHFPCGREKAFLVWALWDSGLIPQLHTLLPPFGNCRQVSSVLSALFGVLLSHSTLFSPILCSLTASLVGLWHPTGQVVPVLAALLLQWQWVPTETHPLTPLPV
jgi:hypothetical protein